MNLSVTLITHSFNDSHWPLKYYLILLQQPRFNAM